MCSRKGCFIIIQCCVFIFRGLLQGFQRNMFNKLNLFKDFWVLLLFPDCYVSMVTVKSLVPCASLVVLLPCTYCFLFLRVIQCLQLLELFLTYVPAIITRWSHFPDFCPPQIFKSWIRSLSEVLAIKTCLKSGFIWVWAFLVVIFLLVGLLVVEYLEFF